MPTQCDEIAVLLPDAVDAAEPVALPVRRHIESCLRCQAELARYRRMLRGLQLLRTQYFEPTPGVLAPDAGQHHRGQRAPRRDVRAHQAPASPTPARWRARSPPPAPPPRPCSSPGRGAARSHRLTSASPAPRPESRPERVRAAAILDSRPPCRRPNQSEASSRGQ